MPKNYETYYEVIDDENKCLGTFNSIHNAIIFVDGYYEKFCNEPELKLSIIRHFAEVEE